MRVASIKHAVEMKVVADTVAVLQMKAPPQRKARPDYKALWGLAAAQARQPQLAKLTRAVNATAATQWSLISRSDRRGDAVDSGDAASADGAEAEDALLLGAALQRLHDERDAAAMLTPRPPPQSARGARPTSSVRHRRVMSARVARECA